MRWDIIIGIIYIYITNILWNTIITTILLYCANSGCNKIKVQFPSTVLHVTQSTAPDCNYIYYFVVVGPLIYLFRYSPV